ncbi:hypothetical protein CspHIS471_0501610 [Cutaneotrichosporon sp. HIS471]|nr:hypothetical protein CspHIS471_0501610 [Cutaneotrichosporon sp. HIS471]
MQAKKAQTHAPTHTHAHAHTIRFYPEPPFPAYLPPIANAWMPSPSLSPSPTPDPQFPRTMGGIKRSAPPAFPPRRASEPPGPPTASLTHSHSNSQSARMPQVSGWMVGTASHTPGKPHSPHTIESVELPPHVLKFIERGFGMRVVRKDRRGSWDLSNADCLRLVARTRLRRPQDEDRIQAAERGLQAVQLSTPPSAPRTLPSPTTGSPPPGVLRATRVTRSMSKSKPYDRFIEA